MKQLSIAILLGLALIANVQAEGDAEAGKAKAAMCGGCHGMDGNSPAPTFPKLAGQHPLYTAKQLADFKSGERKDPTMAGMAAALTEEDMANLAAFYASQKGTVGEAAPDKVELGETIYRAGNPLKGVSACAACHGPTGNGNPMARFPSLSGQHATYTAAQLRQFRDGTRANDAGSMMRTIAAKMTDAEIDAVAEYIQGLQ